jgi:hypothetical protein
MDCDLRVDALAAVHQPRLAVGAEACRQEPGREAGDGGTRDGGEKHHPIVRPWPHDVRMTEIDGGLFWVCVTCGWTDRLTRLEEERARRT